MPGKKMATNAEMLTGPLCVPWVVPPVLRKHTFLFLLSLAKVFAILSEINASNLWKRVAFWKLSLAVLKTMMVALTSSQLQRH